MMTARRVILASTSPYRRQLLERILPDFESCAPGVEETRIDHEPPAERALRLATLKARAVADQAADALVIGSDQVAALDATILLKPGDSATACEQLTACSTRTVSFHTGVCIVDTRSGQNHVHTDHTQVVFRPLDAATIARYVEREQPLDCAGSFKCEGLGISLFERIENSDPSALIGLPLIAVARMLRSCGIELP